MCWSPCRMMQSRSWMTCDDLGSRIDLGPVMMQHNMKANGKVEDFLTLTVTLLTLKGTLTPLFTRSRVSWLLSLTDGGKPPWLKTWDQISSILSRTLRTMTLGWMKTGHHILLWMTSLLPPKQPGTTLSTLRCFSQLGTHTRWHGSCTKSMTMRGNLWHCKPPVCLRISCLWDAVSRWPNWGIGHERAEVLNAQCNPKGMSMSSWCHRGLPEGIQYGCFSCQSGQDCWWQEDGSLFHMWMGAVLGIEDSSISWQKLSNLKKLHSLQVASLHLSHKLLTNQHSAGGWVGSTIRETRSLSWLSMPKQSIPQANT